MKRIDDTILFTPLSKQEIHQIVLLLVEDLRQRLAEQHLALELSDEASQMIVDSAYDPIYGARPLKRFLQHELETRIGRAIIDGSAVAGQVVLLVVELEQQPVECLMGGQKLRVYFQRLSKVGQGALDPAKLVQGVTEFHV